MSVDDRRVVSADEARGDVSRQSWGPSWTEDLQHTVIVQAEQIAAVLALHDSLACEFEGYPRWTCRSSKGLRERDWCPKCRLAEILGVTA